MISAPDVAPSENEFDTPALSPWNVLANKSFFVYPQEGEKAAI